ncbi:AsmA family protein [Oleidesulfovibrio sp.]|uniref:AsmA family protein n=1 Tax=Oleidesulfovibrio sp. TaxID=2909707 RepID=UPI003A8C203E
MHKRILWVFAGALCVLVATVLIAAVTLFDSDFLSATLEDLLTKQLETSCHINGPVNLALFPVPGLEAEDIVVDQPEGFVSSSPLLTAEKVLVQFKLNRIFSGIFELGHSNIQRPVISLVREVDGRANWQALAEAFGGTNRLEAPADLQPELPFKLADSSFDGFRMMDGTIQLEDRQNNIALSASELNLSLTGGEARTFSVDGEIALNNTIIKQNFSIIGEMVVDDTENIQRVLGSLKSEGIVTILGRQLPATLDTGIDYDIQQGLLDIVLAKASLDRAELSGEVKLIGFWNQLVLNGDVSVAHLSLPFWFEFGQYLPDSLQHALDDLSGSLTFQMDKNGLVVSALQASVLGMPLSGKGGVYDFAKPVISIDVSGRSIDVNKVFPELSVTPPATLPRRIGNEPPVLLFEDSADDDESGIGYDIRVAADNFSVFGFEGQGLSFRCWPSEQGTYTSYDVASIYGGSVKSLLDIRDDFGFQVDVQNVSIDIPAKLLAGKEVAGGILNARADVVADASTIQGLLADLHGRLDVDISSGFFAVKSKRLAGGSFELQRVPFERFDFALKMDGKSADPDKQKGLLPYYWNLKGAQRSSASDNTSFSLIGPVALDPLSLLPEALHNARFKIIRKMPIELPSGTEPRVITYEGRVTADLIRGNVQVSDGNAEFIGIKAGWDASTKDIYSDEAWNGTFDVNEIPVRRVVSTVWGKDSFLPPDPRVLNYAELSGQFRYAGKRLNLEIAQGQIDKTVFAASVEALPEKQIYSFVLDADNVDMDRYLPKAAKGQPEDKPFDFSGLRKLTLQGVVSLGHLIYKNMAYSDVQASLSCAGGRVAVEPLRAQLYGGTVSGSFRGDLTDTKGLTTKASFSFQEVDFGKLTTRFAGDAYVTGTADISFDVAGVVDSSADVPAGLDGNWQFVVRNGEYSLRKQEEGKDKPVSYSFSAASASGSMTRGVLRNDDFNLSGPLITITGKGDVDLGRELIDYTAIVSFARIPSFPVRLRGSMYDPNVNVKHLEILPRTIGNIGGGVFSIIRGIISVPLKAADKLIDGTSP